MLHWLIISAIIVIVLVAFVAFVAKLAHRPPSGPKGRQLPPDDSDQHTFIAVHPRRPQATTRSHHHSDRKK